MSDLRIATRKIRCMFKALPIQPEKIHVEFLRDKNPKIGHHAVFVYTKQLLRFLDNVDKLHTQLAIAGEGLKDAGLIIKDLLGRTTHLQACQSWKDLKLPCDCGTYNRESIAWEFIKAKALADIEGVGK